MLPPVSMKRAFTFFVMASLAASPALAQRRTPTPPSSGLTGEADQHFTAGIRFAGESNYAGAAVEFHRAYDLSHNALVLFNLAAVELELGHFQEANDALASYERDAPPAVIQSRQPVILQLRQRIAQRSGTIEVQLTHPGLRVEIDGAQGFRVLREGDTVRAPVRVPVGRYRVQLSAPNFRPREQQLDVAGGESQRITNALEAVPVAFTIRSNIDDAEVSIDGTVVGRTPLAAQQVSQGRHRIEVSRPGYEVFRADPEISGVNTALDVRLQWLPTMAEDVASHVSIVSTHASLSVLLDGRPIDPSGADAVPPGRHTLRITGPDIEPHEEQIELPAGRRTTMTPTLTLRRDLALAQAGSSSTRRTIGYIVGGVGAATMLGGGIWLGLTVPEASSDYQRQAQFERIIEGCGERVGQLVMLRTPEDAFVRCVNARTTPPSNYTGADAIGTDASTNIALSNESTSTLTIAGIVTGVGLVALTTGIILIATAGSPPPAPPSRTARMAPRFVPTGNGFALHF
ncbi:MAG: PEGA domain-containing protein [Deltaproteobacteria bacterium]|nr:PEGA domain-containing protein [Deltaproteobacteria bacterium]